MDGFIPSPRDFFLNRENHPTLQAEGVSEFKLFVDACAAVLRQAEFLLNRQTFLRGDDLASLQTLFSDGELFGHNAEVDAIVSKVIAKK